MALSLYKKLGIVSLFLGLLLLSLSSILYWQYTTSTDFSGITGEMNRKIIEQYIPFAQLGILLGFVLIIWGIYLSTRREMPRYLYNLLNTKEVQRPHMDPELAALPYKERKKEEQRIKQIRSAEIQLERHEEEDAVKDFSDFSSKFENFYLQDHKKLRRYGHKDNK